ncbi:MULTISPECIES: acyl-CoA dehydrogenase family protein [Streptomyces]|uniref:DNA alkylation response protein n=1 Tax=Streptomyces dengpaensis TaxID=2049881 RepID=A0ABN5IBT9_9ACTN|nr:MULTISPECIES: acyl-CoA dehydrogenase family protein [Streptomyces]AVH60650.1 DNA alkylation response protein [Streptomyces dengpaensis]PIB03548.1 DNA alkylation response protein [Streptomyces sp. HG99]
MTVTEFPAGIRPAQHRTHDVVNQAPRRVDIDEYGTNQPLMEGVRQYGAAWHDRELHEIGALVGSEKFQSWAESAHTSPPELRTHDRYGNRVDEVDFHPAYHDVLGAAVRHGAHTSGWADPKPGGAVARAATFMLFAQIEPGHACPTSMAHAVVPVLQRDPEVGRDWLPGLLSRSYDPRMIAPGLKSGLMFGMGMTEKQGGSDVRANTTVAAPVLSDPDGRVHLLTGHKWFFSAPQSDAFLVLAQADAGLTCFLVPRVLPDGTRNTIGIQRLKNKLGNKSNASSEVEFDGTWAQRIGEPGRGVPTIIEMVNHTRLDCVLGTTAGMRQSLSEAVWHARHRRAFGARLTEQPAMTAVLADLALETEAATWTALRLAHAYEAGSGESEAMFRRLATAVSKYWICKRGPQHAYEALECLGGNGYTEDWPLARRYREQPLLAVWEGSGNVIALDVLRGIAKTPQSLDAFWAELEQTAGIHAVLDTHLRRVRQELSRDLRDPVAAQTRARATVEGMALALQSSLMLRHAPAPMAEAFIAARLGEGRGHHYGILPHGTDAAAIVERHAADSI